MEKFFIDVKRDESAPFIVKTAQFDVQVLGTAFDIKAYSGTFENAEVVLVRGKVNVKSKSGRNWFFHLIIKLQYCLMV